MMIVLAYGIWWVISVLLLVSTATVASASLVINVKDSGRDSLDCLKGITPCQSLEYIFNNIMQANESWTVLIENSQKFTNAHILKTMNLHNANISVGPLLKSSAYERLEINFNGLKITTFQQLTFHSLSVSNLLRLRNGLIAEFYDCFVKITWGCIELAIQVHFFSINKMIFTKCTFGFDSCNVCSSTYGSGWLSIGHSVNELTFIDCTFKHFGISPFIYFRLFLGTNDISFTFRPEIIFDRCSFHHTGCKDEINWQQDGPEEYQSYWIQFDYGSAASQLIINNCSFLKVQDSRANSLVSITGEFVRVTINNTLFSHNQLSLNTDFAALLSLTSTVSHLINVTFLSNIGAAISSQSVMDFHLLNVSFINNTGRHSGGIVMLESYPNPNFIYYGTVLFKDNRYTDIYGGVMFVQNPCTVKISVNRDKSLIHFEDETQYFFFLMMRNAYEFCFDNMDEALVNNIRTVPYKIQISKHPQITVFPGQPILLQSVNITDYYGHESQCTTTQTYMAPLLTSCNESACVKGGGALARNQVALKGKKLIFIQSTEHIQTSLYFTSKHEHILPLHNMRSLN